MGVVRQVEHRVPANPNKWGKALTPWFTEECREAKQEYLRLGRLEGRQSTSTRGAQADYLRVCKRAKQVFAAALPDMMKYQPK